MKIKAKLPQNTGGELEMSAEELKIASTFFQSIIPGVIKDSIGILNDRVKFIRFKKIIEIIKEANDIARKNGMKIKELPLGFGVQYIEQIPLQDEPIIQQMWANLLANVSGGNVNPNTIFISILNNLTPVEAEILDIFYSNILKRDPPLRFLDVSLDITKRDLIKKYSDVDVAIDNLFRLKLIENPPIRHANISLSLSGGYGGSIHSSTYGKSREMEELVRYLESEKRAEETSRRSVKLTSLGYKLVKACHEPEFNKDKN